MAHNERIHKGMARLSNPYLTIHNKFDDDALSL